MNIDTDAGDHPNPEIAVKGSFGWALNMMRNGYRVRRPGWNGKGMYVAIQDGSVINRDQARGGVALYHAKDGNDRIKINSHIDMLAADGSVVVGWLASQTDMLGRDWELAE